MNRINFKQVILLIIAGVAAAIVAACQPSDTPTDAIKRLHAAVQKKDAAAIKKEMSKTTMEFAEGQAAMRKISIEEMLKNGLTQTAMGAEAPQTRDERIKDNFAAVEAQNPQGIWEDLPFVKENGAWKLAIGDVFKGSYQSPGAPASRANQPPMMPVPEQNLINSNTPTAVAPSAANNPANADKNANQNGQSKTAANPAEKTVEKPIEKPGKKVAANAAEQR